MSTDLSAPAPYQDRTRPVGERVSDLLARMTREEKIAQLGSLWAFQVTVDTTFSPERARALLARGIGHITRVSGATTATPEEAARLANDIQRFLVDETRLGIPAIVHEEVCSGVMARDATIFPQAIGVASTWEPDLNRRLADVVRAHMRAVGAHQGLSPVLDVARDPRWGRTEETYGEDPHLVAAFGTAFVHGLQGERIDQGVLATAKHFVGYSASEGGLNWAPAHLPPRELREVYLHPFEAAVREAGVASVMNGYHELDGVPCGASRALLTGILRDEWGFTGTVVADYFAVDQLASYHRLARNQREAAALALVAGIDIELPGADCYADPLAEALDAGEVDERTLDDAVARALRQKFDLGLFERPYVDPEEVIRVVDDPAHRDLALEIARKSLVLLKNDAGVLPLAADATVAVIGPNADDARNLLGDYSHPAHMETLAEARGQDSLLGGMPTVPEELQVDARVGGIPTILGELSARLGDRVSYARGCDVLSEDRSGVDEAARVAAAADVAVLVVGDKAGLTDSCTSGEARDRSSLDLPGVQEELARAVVETGTPTVLVLVAGRPCGSAWLHARAAAALIAWLPGETGARAVAEVLVGAVEPGGSLPMSFPRSAGHVPTFYGHKTSGGRSHWKGDYVDAPVAPLYPFGHGLGYTHFALGVPELPTTEVELGGVVEVEVEVSNRGDRDGERVVQLYVRDPQASVTRPVLELKHFVRVAAPAGATRTVTFALPTGMLGFYAEGLVYTVEPGIVELFVGLSATDLTPACRVTILAGDSAPAKVFTGSVTVV